MLFVMLLHTADVCNAGNLAEVTVTFYKQGLLDISVRLGGDRGQRGKIPLNFFFT
jgi:hypothetical protein